MSRLSPSCFLLAAAILALRVTGAAEARSEADEAAVVAALDAGDYDAAAKLAEAWVAADAGSGRAQLLFGQALDGLADDARADDCLARALELAPGDLDVLAGVADVYASRFARHLGSEFTSLAPAARARAEELYATWFAAAPASPLPLQRRAWIATQAGERERAIGLLFAAAALDPLFDIVHADLWGYVGAGVSYEELAGFYEGLGACERPTPVRARCIDLQGQILARGGDALRLAAANAADGATEDERRALLDAARASYARALPCFDAAAALEPAVAAAMLRYDLGTRAADAECLADVPDLAAVASAVDDVRTRLDPALRAEPADAGLQDIADRLSFALFTASGGEGGDPVGMAAIADFWKWATGAVADRADWWNNLGFFCRESGRYEESYQAYRRSIELAPENVRYVNDTGLILLYHLDRDLDEAERLFRRAIDLGDQQYASAKDDPALEPELRSAYGDALLNLGRLATKQRRFDDAAGAFQRLAELDGERFDLRQSQIDLAVARGDFASALTALDAIAPAIASAPEPPAAVVDWLSSIRAALARQANAVPEMTRLLERVTDLLKAIAPPSSEPSK